MSFPVSSVTVAHSMSCDVFHLVEVRIPLSSMVSSKMGKGGWFHWCIYCLGSSCLVRQMDDERREENRAGAVHQATSWMATAQLLRGSVAGMDAMHSVSCNSLFLEHTEL